MKAILYLGLILACGELLGHGANQLANSLRAVRAIGPEGQGNAEASAAWKTIAAANVAALPTILAAMDGANELAVNWLRAAVDAIAAREQAAGRTLPSRDLERFLKNTRHHPRARRLAYELLLASDRQTADKLLRGLLDDPSAELRRDAVQQRIDAATASRKAGQTNQALATFRAVLPSARDVDQVESIAKNLKELGSPVALPSVFGWLASWKVVGPFDSTGGAGFEAVYPPETAVDLGAQYDGKSGKVQWKELKAKGDYGLIDFNGPLGALKEVAGYAFTEVTVEKARAVELRLGCKNAWKIWVNGQYLFGRDEYHRGAEIDQYRLNTQLKSGRNTILVKLCQNEQKEDWTKEWEFQLRITDELGQPVRF
jgi:hypothetical protein